MKCVAWLAPVFLLTSIATGQPRELFFGLNGVAYFHYRDQPDAAQRAQQRLDAMLKIGATSDRFDFWWSEIEPQPGKWKWDKADWLIEFYSRRGVGMLPILCYQANWMSEPPRTDEDFRQFAQYVFQCVNRYKGHVKHWEIWNEPNIPTFWDPPNPEHYARLLKPAYAAAKRADPDCIIVGASANETDINWVIDIFAHGAGDAMDALSFHPYSMSDGPEEMDLHRQIQNLRAVLAKLGKPDMPLWITEMGWQADIAREDEVRKQSRYMVQSHVIALAEGVEKLFWFNLQDFHAGDKVEGWGMLSAEGTAKASLMTYAQMTRQLEGATFRGYVPMENGIAYVFDRRGRAFAVAWSHRGTTQQWMNRKLTPDPIIVPLRAVSVPALTDRLPPRENLAINGSLEESAGEIDSIYGWRRGMFYGGNDNGTFAVSADAADGKRAASIASAEDAIWQSFPIYSMPGEHFTLTAKIKTIDASGENAVQMLFLSGSGWGYEGGPSSNSITGTSGGWRDVSVTGVVPDDANIVRINLVSKNNTGRVIFDDVKLTRNNGP